MIPPPEVEGLPRFLGEFSPPRVKKMIHASPPSPRLRRVSDLTPPAVIGAWSFVHTLLSEGGNAGAGSGTKRVYVSRRLPLLLSPRRRVCVSHPQIHRT